LQLQGVRFDVVAVVVVVPPTLLLSVFSLSAFKWLIGRPGVGFVLEDMGCDEWCGAGDEYRAEVALLLLDIGHPYVGGGGGGGREMRGCVAGLYKLAVPLWLRPPYPF
jgi:hypothetical protein